MKKKIQIKKPAKISVKESNATPATSCKKTAITGPIPNMPCGGMVSPSNAMKILEFMNRCDVTPMQLSKIVVGYDKFSAADKKVILAYAKSVCGIKK